MKAVEIVSGYILFVHFHIYSIGEENYFSFLYEKFVFCGKVVGNIIYIFALFCFLNFLNNFHVLYKIRIHNKCSHNEKLEQNFQYSGKLQTKRFVRKIRKFPLLLIFCFSMLGKI